MLCVMGQCSSIVQYRSFGLHIFNKNYPWELKILYMLKRNFKMQFRKYWT